VRRTKDGMTVRTGALELRLQGATQTEEAEWADAVEHQVRALAGTRSDVDAASVRGSMWNPQGNALDVAEDESLATSASGR
jgi:hypothetical protein